MRFNHLLFIILLVGTLTFVSSASIGSFQLDIDDVQIYQTCNNCTYGNFTRVMGPNNQTIISNVNAIADGSYYYYDILKGNFTENGKYSYCYDFGNSVESTTGCIDFEITYSGGELTIQMTMIYLISIFTLIFFFTLIILLITKLPTKDATDEEGTILQISNLKHLRPALWGISWSIILAIIFIIGNVSLAYLPSTMIGDIFLKLFMILFGITIVALPLWLIWIFTGIFRDKEFKKLVERGVDIKSTP